MTGDVMRRLAEARPAHLDPGARVDDSVRQAELAQAMAMPRRASRHRTRGTARVWGLGLVGAAAAAALVVATTATGPGDGTGEAGDGGPSGGPSGHAKVTKLNARTVLLSAAAVRQPVSSGKYWYTRMVTGNLRQVGPANRRYTMEVRYEEEIWQPISPQLDGWYRDRYVGAKPASPADQAAWRADGSPVRWRDEQCKKGKCSVEYIDTRPGRATAPESQGKMATSPESVVHLQRKLSRTPPTVAALRKMFVGEQRNGKGTDAQLLDVAAMILVSAPVKPEVRSGIYRLLAEIKGISAVGGVRDPLGRPGVALKLQKATFIFDPGTATGLSMAVDGYFQARSAAEWVNTLPF